MRKIIALLAAVVTPLFFAGCIALPIPHDQPVSPRFFGIVRDAATQAPMEGVKVTLSDYAQFEKKSVTATTDREGHYELVEIERERWLIISLFPGDAFPRGKLTFEHPNYIRVEETRHVARGSVGTGMYVGLRFNVSVEMKKKEPNQTPATPTAGTSAAEQPRVPASGVAQL